MYWLADIQRQGRSPCHPSPTYQVFRNVKHFGARGDGITDDTAAINRAISEGGRCGGGEPGTDSSTTSPALVYIPSGTYRITSPIISYYNTSIQGDATRRPVLQADPNFHGLSVIDENPYLPGGRNWYTNQNNFFRSVSHLIIDQSKIPRDRECSGIHHQVAQATGLRRVHFEMPVGPNRCQGVRMENGSGGHMTSLTFRGGDIGIWAGNQQFTVQNCRFIDCRRAISQHWCWTFVYHKIWVERCEVGLEMRVEPCDGGSEKEQAAASVICVDWNITDTAKGFDIVSPRLGARGSLLLSNVHTSGVSRIATRSTRDWNRPSNGQSVVLLAPADGQTKSEVHWSWQGDNRFFGTQTPSTGPVRLPRPKAQLDESGSLLSRPRPEYLEYGSDKFVSVKDHGAVGDGHHDDTVALQSCFDNFAGSDVVFWIPHGHYILTQTLVIPSNARIVGEVWPVLLGTGAYFQDSNRPQAVIQVGRVPGEQGRAEISECIFSTKGSCPGAIVLRWNLAASSAGQMPGMWDTHIRLGGFIGSNLDDQRFDKDKPLQTKDAWACFLAWHLPRESAGCFVNNWVWLADHTLDTSSASRHAGTQISLLASRGILIESNPGPVLLWGGASEHFLLYQYQINEARNVFIGAAQTESPYFLGEGVSLPSELAPPVAGAPWHDPTWKAGSGSFDARSWGFRIRRSSHTHVYGPGLYSFFDAYKQEKLVSRTCQRAVMSVEDCNTPTAGSPSDEENVNNVTLVGLSTVGTKSMLDRDGKEMVAEEPHRNGFSSTYGYWLC